MLATLLVSCKNDETTREAVYERVANVYKSSFIELPEDYSANGDFSVINDRIFLLCTKIINEETWETEMYLYSVGINGENPESLKLEKSAENSYINQLKFDPDGNMYLLENSYDPETYQEKFIIKKLSPSGDELLTIEPTDMFPASNSDRFGGMGGSIYIQYFQIAPDGMIYVTSQDSVVVISAEGEKLFHLTIENYIDNLFILPDGRACIFTYDYTSGNGGMIAKPINNDKKDFDVNLDLPSDIMRNINSISFGPDFDLYLRDDTGVFGYNEGDTEATKLLDWINSDIISNNTSSFYIKNKDCFIYSGHDMVARKQQIVILNRIPDDEVVPKLLIHLATPSYIPYTLNIQMVAFNQSNDTYRVVFDTYQEFSTDEDWQNGEKVLANDVLTGKDIDIVLMSSMSLSQHDLIKKDVFADLYKFIDADNEVSREQFIKCIFKPFEHNGKLPQFVLSFSISSIAGKTSNLEGKTTWTIDEMLAFNESLGSDRLLFSQEYMTKATMLQTLLSFGYTSFINYDTLQCTFDSDSFKNLLKFCNDNYPNEYDYSQRNEYDPNEDRTADLRNNKQILGDAYIYSFGSYLETKSRFNFEPISIIGYPTNFGNGSRLDLNESYAIIENSPVKDGAWKFIKFMATAEISDNFYSHGLPSYKKSLTKLAEEEMKNFYFFHFNGGWSSGTSGEDSTEIPEWIASQTDGLPGRLTQADVDELMAFLDGLTYNANLDQQIFSMISEEAASYFAGDKSVDEVAKVLQSTISIYISESN